MHQKGSHGLGFQIWKSTEDLGLQGDLAEEWRLYVNLLNHNAICLKDSNDELSWSINKSLWVLTTKLGYETKINKDLEVERLWWWKVVWKLVCPLK
jgi:hypothetical protein